MRNAWIIDGANAAADITATPAWDANGNLTSDGVRAFTWGRAQPPDRDHRRCELHL
jgi:hypothetical protein